MDEYPQLFHDENLPNCCVIEEDGRLVSHVGMTLQDASIFGSRVRVACIGGVATYPEYRGRGYATACFADAMAVARADGCDFMMVSGDRSLYRMAGCRRVGMGFEATLPAQVAERLAEEVTLRQATSEDIPTLSALHRAEPLHWVRPPETWERALACGWVMNRPCEFWIVERDGLAWGYLILQKSGERETPWVSEFAGDRRLLLAAFARLVAQKGLATLRWYLSGADRLGLGLARSAGLPLREAHTSGTYLIVNFPQLMERLRPYIAQFAGDRTARALRFDCEEDAHVVTLDSERFVLPNQGCAAHYVFGTREERATPPPDAGRLGEVYRAAFPIPALWYGVNYV
jgi:predicted N-acetyltransferase YhbS